MADKPQRYITPKGVAVFPWLDKPDTKYKPEGEYRCKVRFSEEVATPLIEQLQPLHDKAVEAARKNPKRKAMPEKKFEALITPLYNDVTDEEGNPTGEVEFNFKRLASGVSKKTGKPWAIKPDLFDAKGRKLAADAKVYGGSLVKISFEVVPYDTPKSVGIKLSLAGVQVIKLVEGQGRSAGQYGFGDESEDEDADEVNENFADESTGGSDDDTGEGDAF
jgi:hypothetical protein